MGLSLVTAPSAEPVSLAEAKAHLRVSHPSDDALIATYLMAARAAAENYTRRALAVQTFDQTFDYDYPCSHDGRPRLVLLRSPLVSVTSVSYVDTAGATQTLNPSQYLVDAIGIEGRIEPAYGVTWPEVRDQMAAVTVRFVAGYAQIPEPVRAAILLTLGHLYEHREDVVIGPSANELPRGADALLFPYRVFY
jgi:uncharacterized phiE125 gp8 family phage protein